MIDSLFNQRFFLSSSTIKGTFLLSSLFKSYGGVRDTTLCTLKVDNKIDPLIIEGPVDFKNSVIPSFEMENVVFRGVVDFSETSLGVSLLNHLEKTAHLCKLDSNQKKRPILFKKVTFGSNVYFNRSLFTSDAVFKEVLFSNLADFSDIFYRDDKHSISPKMIFISSRFNDLRISLNLLPNLNGYMHRVGRQIEEITYHKLQEASSTTYRFFDDLEVNLRKYGKLSEAYRVSFFKKKADLWRKEPGKGNMHQAYKWLVWIFWGNPFGYGLMIWRIVITTLLIDMVFAFIYFKTKSLYVIDQKGHVRRWVSLKTERFTLSYPEIGKIFEEWLNAVSFSSKVLFKIPNRDIRICRRYNWIWKIEWVIGVVIIIAMVKSFIIQLIVY